MAFSTYVSQTSPCVSLCREFILKQFHSADITERFVGITKVDVRRFINSCPTGEGGKGQLQQPCVKVLGLEHSATLSTNNLELVRGNLREVIEIEHPLQCYHRAIWRHSTTAGGDISK